MKATNPNTRHTSQTKTEAPPSRFTEIINAGMDTKHSKAPMIFTALIDEILPNLEAC